MNNIANIGFSEQIQNEKTIAHFNNVLCDPLPQNERALKFSDRFIAGTDWYRIVANLRVESTYFDENKQPIFDKEVNEYIKSQLYKLSNESAKNSETVRPKLAELTKKCKPNCEESEYYFVFDNTQILIIICVTITEKGLEYGMIMHYSTNRDKIIEIKNKYAND